MVRRFPGTFPKGTAIPGVDISLAKSKAHAFSLALYNCESQKYVDSVKVLWVVLIKDFHCNGWVSAHENIKNFDNVIYSLYELNIRALSELSLEAGPSS